MKAMQDKKSALMKALVAAFGEGAVISRKQLLEVWNKAKASYPHSVVIEKNMDYRVGRGMYVVTATENVTKVRDAAIAKMKAMEAQKEKALPKSTRKSAEKLAKAVMKTKPVKTSKTSQKVSKTSKTTPVMPVSDNYIVTQDDIDESFGGNDINDIMRTM